MCGGHNFQDGPQTPEHCFLFASGSYAFGALVEVGEGLVPDSRSTPQYTTNTTYNMPGRALGDNRENKTPELWV